MSQGVNSPKPTTSETVGGVYNATPPTLVDGQAASLQLDVNGQLKTTSGGGGGSSNVNLVGINGTAPAITNPLPVELSDGTNPFGTVSNPVRVDPTGTTPQPVTGPLTDTQLRATPVPVSGTVTATGPLTDTQLRATPVPVSGTITAITNQVDTNLKQVGGANTATAVSGVQLVGIEGRAGTSLETTAGVLDENIKNVGNSAVATAASGVQKVGVVGNAGAIFDGATAAAAPANAVQAGMRGSTTVPTAVTDGQLVGARSDKYGNQVAVLNAPRDLIGTAILNSNSSTTVSFISAGAANVFNDIISLIITNESSTATVATLTDNGSGGNTYKFALAANGGIVINFPTPLPQGTAAAAWQVLNSAGVTLDWVAVYAKNK